MKLPAFKELRFPRGMELVQSLFGGWTACVLFFLYIPVLVLVVYSFNASRLNLEWGGFTFGWYVKLFQDTEILRTFKNSLIVAGATVALAVPLGTGVAWLLHRYAYQNARTIGMLAYLPMVVPEIIMGISLLVLFNTLGITRGHETIIIAHTTFCVPFVMAAVQARLAGLDPSLEEAALDLGATPLKAFFLVIVPYLMPAILSGALMTFALSMDELIVTCFTFDASSKTLPIHIFGLVKKGVNPSINALSTLFILATIALLFAAEWQKRNLRS